ncbi:MAG: PASTA domain-containing protein [Treponema sp.]|jgi:beta-lactam-binding protein with PASTA domain|nr:PASTA domain-containing protein [Treponema sp.]
MKLFRKIDSTEVEALTQGRRRGFLLAALALLVVMALSAAAAFFISLRGNEQTLVPDVVGEELIAALLEMQARELYPRIQLRYSSTARDRGLVTEQDPLPGSIVKAGRRVKLVVSQGTMVTSVAEYVGRSIDEVRAEAAAINAEQNTAVPLLTIREPVMLEYSSAAPGTILQQKPEAGLGIFGPTLLEFVVSRGAQDPVKTVPGFAGMSIEAALAEIGRSGINFTFVTELPKEGQKEETVISQQPAPGTEIPADTKVTLIATIPLSLKDDETAGLFRCNVPKNPYPLRMRVESIPPQGDKKTLLETEYPGGEFAMPYRVPVGSILTLTLVDKELYRETVGLGTAESEAEAGSAE